MTRRRTAFTSIPLAATCICLVSEGRRLELASIWPACERISSGLSRIPLALDGIRLTVEPLLDGR